MRRFVFVLAGLLTGSMLVSTVSHSRLEAQAIQSSILGNIRDSAGAAVPRATVTLINEGTNDERKQTTDEAGDYRFSGILAGTYRISVESPGFKVHITNDITVNLTETTSWERQNVPRIAAARAPSCTPCATAMAASRISRRTSAHTPRT